MVKRKKGKHLKGNNKKNNIKKVTHNINENQKIESTIEENVQPVSSIPVSDDSEKNQEIKKEENLNIENEKVKEEVSNSKNEKVKDEVSKPKKEKVKKEKTKKSKVIKKVIITLVVILILAGLVAFGYFIYLRYSPKFQSVTIELGTEEIKLTQFVQKDIYLDKAKFVTDISNIDLGKVGTQTIELDYDGVVQTAELSIVDTTAPEVEFQDLNKYVSYELNADDFIKSKSDLSEMTTSIISSPEIKGSGKYEVQVEVKDSSGNATTHICNLNITRVVNEFTMELGEKLEKKNVLLNIEEDADTIDQDDIDEINKKGVGTYELVSELDDVEEVIKITIKDTTTPTLELRDITIYDDEKLPSKEDFIKKAEDASGEVTTRFEVAPTKKIGKQTITIEAADKNGNKRLRNATLTIKEDNDPPVFSGLSNMSVSKNASVNFKKGVKAVDAKDGSVSFSVDTSKVNLGSTGTYYAKYTAKDSKGNSVTKSRKIVVKHNQEDTNRKFNEFYNNYLAGKSITGMAQVIHDKISYNSNWGGDDPVWYGLTNKTGNCYVHALMLQKALNKKGITNQLIYTTDKTHYWNLVKTSSGWRHYDTTPTKHELGPLTDSQKAASAAMRGRKWSSSFPKAE